MPPTALKILVVDDEPPLLKMIGVYLKRVGYAVSLFESSGAAWSAAASAASEYSAAVLDATLAGMSAEELALKLLSANPSIRVVVASGYPVDMSNMEAAGPGRVSFVQKPFTADTLVRTLRGSLGAEEESL